MITITLEGNTWEEIIAETAIVQDCARRLLRASIPAAKPDKGIVAPKKRECQDGPKKPVCAYCGAELGHAADSGPYGQLFCSSYCVDAYMDLIRNAALNRLGDVLCDYQLGPEERAEIMERVR